MGVPVIRARGPVVPQRSPAAMGRRLVGYGISLLAALGIAVAVGDIVGDHYPLVMRGGVAMCLGAQILIVIDCLRPSTDTHTSGTLLWPISVVSTIGMLGIVVGLLTAPAPWPGLEWRTNIWFGPVLQYIVLLHGRHRAAWVPFVVLALLGWSAVTVLHELDWRIQVLDLVFTITPMATLGIGGACITNLLMELRLSQQRRLDDEQEARRREMKENERRARIRFAHDSLLHSLQQLSRGWARLSVTDLRGVASTAMDELQASSQSLGDDKWVAIRPALEAALADQGCAITWHGGVTARTPGNVGDAFVGAAREAVRNVVKHARGSAKVHIARAGSGFRVSITDDGAGFDPTRPTDRVGIQQSIVARMAEAGGRAVISSSASGSVVKLEWPAGPPDAVEAFGPMARTLISWLPIPVLLASLIHVSLFEVGPSALGVAAIWTMTAIIAVLGMRRLRLHGLAGWQPWVLTGISMALLVANYSWISPVGTNGYHVWTPSLVGALMVLALPGRRLGHAIIMAVGVIAVTVATSAYSLGWETTLGAQFGSVMAVVMYVSAPLALATGASILANHSRRTEELAAAQRLNADLATARGATRRAWIARMRELTEPLLEDVAHGVSDPRTSGFRQQAKIIESRLRDELSLWPDGVPLADSVHTLREKGWECSVDMAVNHQRERGELMTVITYLPDPIPGQRLHLTHRQGRAVATITDPPLSEDQRHRLAPDAEAVLDEDFTQVRASLVPSHVPGLTEAPR